MKIALPTRLVEDLKAIRASRALRPNRDTLRAQFPQHYREERNKKTGKPEWVVDVPVRDKRGNRTKVGRVLEEMWRPHAKAEVARGQKLRARQPKEMLMAPEGPQYVAPHLAKVAADSNGWRAVTKMGGARIERGREGMLFRWLVGEWQALGVSCLGTPLRGSARVPRRGIQHDPSGDPWRFVAGKWVRL